MKGKIFFLLMLSFLTGYFLPIHSLPVPQEAQRGEVLNNPTDEAANEAQLNAWKIEAAKTAAEYVQLLDQRRYADSWGTGSLIFQRTISQKEWTVALDLARSRLGRAKERTLKDERIAWDPKGLPKGAYMVVEYDTSFEKAPNSGELLTLRLENGKWKVLTYQVN